MRVINILLYFNLTPSKIPIYEKKIQELNLSYLVITNPQINNQLDNIFNDAINKVEEYEHEFPHDLLVFNQVSEAQIEAIQNYENANELHSLKAMRTSTNSAWTLKEMCKELNQEYAYFSERDLLYTKIQNNQKINIEKTPEALWEAYEKAFYNAYECIQNSADYSKLVMARELLDTSYDAILQYQKLA